jgi:small subunit ribosomal protein S14
MVRNKKIKRKYGKGSKKCARCGSMDAIIRKYSLMYCRRCFREVANDLGFRKLG